MLEDALGKEQTAELLAGVRGFDLSRFELRGVIRNLPIVEIPIEDLDLAWELAYANPEVKAVEANQKDVLPASSDLNSLLVSLGANPCNIAVTFSDGAPLVMHSFGSKWTEEEEQKISGATEGIVGGGKATLKLHEKLYSRGSLQIIPPPIRAADFNVALTVSGVELDKDRRLPSGLYFAYDSRNAAHMDPLIEWVEYDIRFGKKSSLDTRNETLITEA